MRDSTELPTDIRQEIEALCAEGDRLTDERGVEAAVEAYGRAWDLLPEPKTDWAAATWILSAIGEACYLGGLRASAREALERAVDTDDGRENPLLRLRLGQVLHDLDERDRAAEHLLWAYRVEGEAILADENPRYLAFIRERLGLPTAETPAGAPGIIGLIRAFRGLLKR